MLLTSGAVRPAFYAGCYEARMLVSNDGTIWEERNTNPMVTAGSSSGDDYGKICANQTSGTVIAYVSSPGTLGRGGLSRTSDGGRSWTDALPTFATVMGSSYSTPRDISVYGSTWVTTHSDAYLFSTDDGLTWTRVAASTIQQGATGLNGDSLNKIFYNPFMGYWYLIANNVDIVLRTTNLASGASWVRYDTSTETVAEQSRTTSSAPPRQNPCRNEQDQRRNLAPQRLAGRRVDRLEHERCVRRDQRCVRPHFGRFGSLRCRNGGEQRQRRGSHGLHRQQRFRLADLPSRPRPLYTYPHNDGVVKVQWSPDLKLFVLAPSTIVPRMWTSPDGITWSSVTLPASYFARGLAAAR